MGVKYRNRKNRRPRRRPLLLPVGLLALCGLFIARNGLPLASPAPSPIRGLEVQPYSPEDEAEEEEPLPEDLPTGASVSEAVLPEAGKSVAAANVSPITSLYPRRRQLV